MGFHSDSSSFNNFLQLPFKFLYSRYKSSICVKRIELPTQTNTFKVNYKRLVKFKINLDPSENDARRCRERAL